MQLYLQLNNVSHFAANLTITAAVSAMSATMASMAATA
jgi:hypothetical protein